MGIFDKTIWGADNTYVHCEKKIKVWQSYTRPSTYVIHDKCFGAYMKEREKGIPRKKNDVEVATKEVMNKFKEEKE